jgi:hypothetical protein
MSAQRCVFCDEPVEPGSNYSFCDACYITLSLDLPEDKVEALDVKIKKNAAARIVEGFKIAKGED